MTSPNSNSNSTPPRASFASALAQKQAAPVNNSTTSSKQESPSKASKITSASTSTVDQSPIVKLPAGTPVVTNEPAASVKVAPIKFGSFAAAAAAAQETSVVAGGPTLPPRTQSAPPSVVEMVPTKNESVSIPSNPSTTTSTSTTAVSTTLEEPTVVLPVIQEDSQPHHPQVSFNYEQPPQPIHGQQQQQFHPHHNQYPPQNHHYQPRPRYHNPQHHQQQQQQQRYYNPQQQQQPQQYYHNPNYRPNYRPRPQYQATEGYYHPGMAAQGSYYPPHMSAGPNGVAFQRPAPAFNNYVRPVVAPTVPVNIPGFVASSVPQTDAPVPTIPATASIPANSTSTPAAAAPVFVKPAPSKIKIVDPTTGKELNFGSKDKEEPVVEAPKPAETAKPVEPVVKTVETVKPAEIAKPVEPVVVQPVKPAAAVPTPSAPTTPAKKISIVIKDPSSKQELDLSQVVARPVIKEDLAVDELTAAFSQSTKLVETTCESPLPISESPLPVGNFEHDKTILANLNVDDDDVSDDEDEDDDDYSDYSSDEEDEEIYIPSTVQYNQSIPYPDGFIPFKAPADETGVWLYSRDFMLQFRDKCTTTPGDLQERLSAAVEKAKAFASSERMNGGDRSHRRDGHREDRKKRRNHHNGALGPQAHLLDMNAVLKNRAENAWAPVRSAEELSQVERILREVKGLLNKLTLEKFHVISDKILALGIMSPDVLSGVIDCVFDKSVSEPRFAPMYAELCYKIVVEELNGLKKSLPANTAPDSQFRRLLVERCQAEYKHKRAWSKKRLEKLLEKAPEAEESAAEAASPAPSEASAAEIPAAAASSSNVGELTEEDYLLIKLKRRVLGNMRFIGEIFKVGLIGEKIMHSIITELLSNVENPEEEEIECLCRLLMTVGAILDKPEAANFWNQYIGRMNWLISQPGKLSSRVRFMVMDTLELRDKKWKTGKAEEGPKTIAQIQREQQQQQGKERGGERGGDRNDRNDRGNKQSAPALKFTSGKQNQNQSQQQQEWNRSGPSKPGQLNRNSSTIRRPPTPSQPSPVASANTESSVGRFSVLDVETETSAEKESTESPSSSSSVSDEERVKKIVSLLDELVQMNNYDDIYEEFRSCGAKSSALSGLLNRAIEGGKKPALLAVIRVFSECPGLNRHEQLSACKQSFGMIDDLAVDVPSIYEIAGQLYSALSLSLPEILDTLSESSDDSAKTRVILQTVANATSQEFKDALLKDAKEFVEKNKKPAIENLMKKLNIEF